MKVSAIDWRALRAQLDPSLLKQRSRWAVVGSCAVIVLSFLGAWTVPWDSQIQVGDYYSSGYSYIAYNEVSGDNGFTTGGFVLPLLVVVVTLALAALRPSAAEPPWTPLVPWAGLGVLVMVWAYFSVRALVDANELLDIYAGTNTSFPGGVALFLIGVIAFGFGARALNRARAAEAGETVQSPSTPGTTDGP